MSGTFYQKPITACPSFFIDGAKGVVGNAFTTVFPAAFLDTIFEIISLFKTLEVDVIAKGFSHVTPVDMGTNFEAVFSRIGTRTDLNSETLLQGWSTSNVNGLIPIFKRYYKLGDTETVPLYVCIEVGMKGHIAPGFASNYCSRPYVKLSFSEVASFSSYFYERDLMLECPASSVSTALPAYSCKLSYVLTESALALYSCPQMLVAPTNVMRNILGKSSAMAAPYQYPSGVLFAKSKASAPASTQENAMTAFLGPKGAANNGATGTTCLAYTPNVVSETAMFIGQGVVEQRGACAPPTNHLGTSKNPSRKFVAPFFYLSESGTVYEYQGVFWISDPNRDVLDIISGSYSYAGMGIEIVSVPCLVTMDTNTSLFATQNIGSFGLGVKL